MKTLEQFLAEIGGHVNFEGDCICSDLSKAAKIILEMKICGEQDLPLLIWSSLQEKIYEILNGDTDANA